MSESIVLIEIKESLKQDNRLIFSGDRFIAFKVLDDFYQVCNDKLLIPQGMARILLEYKKQ